MKVWVNKYISGFMDKAGDNEKKGLRLVFEKNIDSEIKRASKEFCNWLRTQYDFPVRVTVYFKTKEYLMSESGEKIVSTFWSPDNDEEEPYIKMATGDIQDLIKKRGKNNALATLIISIVHDLTYYFQWIYGIDFSSDKSKKQAWYYANRILDKYSETREAP